MSGPSLDFWAYHNRLREVHPGVKLTFVAVAMGVILTSGPGVGLVAFFMAAVLTLGAGVPLRLYLRLLILPLGFLVPGVLAIILDTGAAVSWAVSVAGMRVGVTETGLVLALKLGLRSLAAVSCLYFLALTTPLPAVLGVLRRVGVPALALERGLTLVVSPLLALMKDQVDALLAFQGGHADEASPPTSRSAATGGSCGAPISLTLLKE